jgi:hypothetical protein
VAGFTLKPDNTEDGIAVIRQCASAEFVGVERAIAIKIERGVGSVGFIEAERVFHQSGRPSLSVSTITSSLHRRVVAPAQAP